VPIFVKPECLISVGIFEDFSWIRCEGKGSFLNSTLIKSFADERIAAGDRCLAVDLSACSGMDSTFMGTLASIARRLIAAPGGVLHIAEPGARNQRSLEDLGLDFLMEIDPPHAAWRASLETIRSSLTPPPPTTPPSNVQRTLQVLEAHQTLAGANDRNAETFSTVVSLLESELAAKLKAATPPKDD
jgi:anti-sigma B factor antagonist